MVGGNGSEYFLTEHERDLLSSRDLYEFIGVEFRFRCLKNQKYSLRAYARDLGVQASRISIILRGQSSFSEVFIERIIKRLQWQEPVLSYFRCLALSALQDPGNLHSELMLEARKIRIQYVYTPLHADHRIVDQWELSTFALALLLRFKGEMNSDADLAQKLGITEQKLAAIIADLEAIGWLEKTSQGRVSKVRYVELGDGGSAYHIRSIHRRSLHQALWSLDNLPTEKRHFYSTFFTLSSTRYESLVSLIRTFVLAASEDQKTDEPDQVVYHLGSFLIPLTNISKT